MAGSSNISLLRVYVCFHTLKWPSHGEHHFLSTDHLLTHLLTRHLFWKYLSFTCPFLIDIIKRLKQKTAKDLSSCNEQNACQIRFLSINKKFYGSVQSSEQLMKVKGQEDFIHIQGRGQWATVLNQKDLPQKKNKEQSKQTLQWVKNCHPWALSQEVHSSFPTCSTIYIGRRRWGTFSSEPHLSHWGSAHLTKPWISSENHVWRAASDLTHPNKGKLRHGQISHMNESKACRCVPQQAGGGERESKQQGTTTWQETGMLCNSQFQKRHLFFSSQ